MDLEKIGEAIKNAKPEIQDMLFSERLGGYLQEIANKNNLEEENAFSMVDEVALVILGLKERIKFKDALSSIGIDKNSIDKIADEIDRKIFSELNQRQDGILVETPKQAQTPKESAMATIETKEEAMKRLAERMGTTPSGPRFSSPSLPVAEPDFAKETLAVKEGEIAHEVPHVENPAPVPAPTSAPAPVPNKPEPPVQQAEPVKKPSETPTQASKSSYPSGQDPYREPIE